MNTYKITRFYRDSARRDTIATGLTREEALEHCNDSETSSATATGPTNTKRTKKHGPWFDGFDEEK